MSSESQYMQIAREIERQVNTGELRPGQSLPSVTAMSETFDASKAVVNSALGVLQRLGVVAPGGGTRSHYVRPPDDHPIARDIPGRYEWEKERVFDVDERRRTGVIEQETGIDSIGDVNFRAKFQEVPASPQMAARFHIVAGEPLLHRTYRIKPDEESPPLAVNQQSWIPIKYVRENPDILDESKEPWKGGSMHQFATVGIEFDKTVERHSCRPATLNEVDELHLLVGDWVVDIEKVTTDTEGRVVEIASLTQDARRTVVKFTSQFRRWPADWRDHLQGD